MALKVSKKDKETTQSLLFRFNRAVQKSRILNKARANRFKEREKSDQIKKRAALKREEGRKRYEKLKKLGKTR